jgi:hypothetical protein
LEAEVEALRVDAGRQQEVLMKQRAQTRAAEATVQELQQELENNAGGRGQRKWCTIHEQLHCILLQERARQEECREDGATKETACRCSSQIAMHFR